MSADLFDRYLHLLGVPRTPPGLAALRALTSAHLERVPFENVSKLLFRRDASRRLPNLRQFLDGIEHHRLGGTCYANNHHLHELLLWLGYQAVLCGADMSAPDVHLVNLVFLERTPYLVDAGYGAPFLEPMSLDQDTDHEIVSGRDRYVLKARAPGRRPRMEHRRDGRPRHGYVINPEPRQIEEFAGVIADSFRPEATFMNALMVARFSGGRSLTLRNQTLTEAHGTRSRSRAIDHADLPAVIEREFGIPRDLAHEALRGVELTQNG